MKLVCIFLLGLILSGTTYGATVCNYPCNSDIGDPVQGVTYINEIFVDGNIYLDFSLWGNVGGISGSDTDSYSLWGENIYILAAEQEPPLLNDFQSIFMAESDLNLNLAGSYIFFSGAIIPSTQFVATGDLYVGDFSQYSPVPLLLHCFCSQV